MAFTSINFLIFFGILIILYYVLPKKIQWVVLLAASYSFYLFAGVKYLAFILFTTATTYAVTRFMDYNNSLNDAYIKAHKSEMTKEVMGIIDKYKDGFRYVDINIHKLSMYISNTIKVIAKKANLDRPIEYTDNKRQQKCEPLWLLPLVVLDNRRGEGSGRGSCRN